MELYTFIAITTVHVCVWTSTLTYKCTLYPVTLITDSGFPESYTICYLIFLFSDYISYSMQVS